MPVQGTCCLTAKLVKSGAESKKICTVDRSGFLRLKFASCASLGLVYFPTKINPKVRLYAVIGLAFRFIVDWHFVLSKPIGFIVITFQITSHSSDVDITDWNSASCGRFVFKNATTQGGQKNVCSHKQTNRKNHRRPENIFKRTE